MTTTTTTDSLLSLVHAAIREAREALVECGMHDDGSEPLIDLSLIID